jgi:dihydrofolate synthase/folylpolyglutamate synthase
LIDVEDNRIEQRPVLEAAIRAEGIPLSGFTALEKSKNYLVFGSFSVAEAFLRRLPN